MNPCEFRRCPGLAVPENVVFSGKTEFRGLSLSYRDMYSSKNLQLQLSAAGNRLQKGSSYRFGIVARPAFSRVNLLTTVDIQASSLSRKSILSFSIACLARKLKPVEIVYILIVVEVGSEGLFVER